MTVVTPKVINNHHNVRSYTPSFLALPAGSWSYLNGFNKRTTSTPVDSPSCCSSANLFGVGIGGRRSSQLTSATCNYGSNSPTNCPHHHHHLHHHHHHRYHPLRSRAYTFCLILFLLTFLVVARLLFLEQPTNGKPSVCAETRQGIPPVLHHRRNDKLEVVNSRPDDNGEKKADFDLDTNFNVSVNPNIIKENVRFPRTKRRLPGCVIIGVRKSGTRALLEFMDVHPGIQKAPIEVHFFNKNDKYKLGLDWYRKKMPFSFPGQITVEKTPAYFTTESVPERIKAMNSSIKLLLIVRDPVIRLVSDYVQIQTNKMARDKAIPSFEEVVLLPGDSRVDISFKAVRTSIYILYFRRWLSFFSRKQILVVDGDLLVTDPYLELVQVEKFLGLTTRIVREDFYFNETKGFYCVRNETTEKCLSETKGRKHPEISPDLVSKLRKFYAPYNRDFYKAVGRDFGWPEE